MCTLEVEINKNCSSKVFPKIFTSLTPPGLKLGIRKLKFQACVYIVFVKFVFINKGQAYKIGKRT